MKGNDTMKINALPGIALDRALELWRLPLRLTQTALRQNGDAVAWAPAIAFERFEVGTRELVGGLLNDDRLLARARLQRAKLDELERAAALKTDADRQATNAEKTLASRQQDAERRRAEVRRQADERERGIESRRRQAEQDLEEKTAEREAALERRAEKRRQAVELKDASAKRRQLDTEAAALAKEERAVQAKGRAMRLEDAAARKRTARKATKATDRS